MSVNLVEDASTGRELIYYSQSKLLYRSTCVCAGTNDEVDGNRSGINRSPVAIKTLRPSCSNPETVRAFYKEYDLLSSNRLSSCTAVRKALHKGLRDDGLHEIYLEWVNGPTLEQWIKSVFKKFRSTQDKGNPVSTKEHFCTLATLAHAIVKSVSEIHSAGVVINNISAENIILSLSTGSGADWDDSSSVKIIDLGLAHVLEGSRGSTSTGTEPTEFPGSNEILPSYQDDLRALGVVLYELFSGQKPADDNDCKPHDSVDSEESKVLDDWSVQREENEPQQKKKEKMPLSGNCVPLKELGVPVSLCALVSNMIAATEANRNCTLMQDFYHSIDEIEEDLRFMIRDPDRFLFNMYEKSLDCGSSTENGQFGSLDMVKGTLYGRDEHVSMLANVCNRFLLGEPNGSAKDVVMVSGYAGVGKTSLVLNVCEPLMKARGAFIRGKFDQFQQARPLSVVADAFNEYCNMILNSNNEDRVEIMGAIRDAIGSHGKVLIDLMPSLSKIIGQDPQASVRASGLESLNQLNFLFQEFVRAIAKPSCPVIFFLDDLQWADGTSLELIRRIVADVQISSFLFIGCYRNNEVEKHKPLIGTLHKLEQAGVSISEIKVNTLGIESINTFISDTLHLTPRLTQPLSNIVYRKTGGNPLFVVQFLKSLKDDSMLRFSLKTWRWEWDVEEMNFMNIPDNFVELMKNKMLKLSRDVQWALKVAACLGHQCEESAIILLNGVNVNQISDIVHALNLAVWEGLLNKTETSYIFAHDQIQHAAYSLIPKSERGALHLQIGRLILAQSSALESESFLFLVVDQLNRGSLLINDYNERTELARLNLKAGEKAMSCSDFFLAGSYLKAGASLVDDEKDWERNYVLVLKLVSRLAEADYITGNFSRMKLSLGKLFINAKCFDDKLGAYHTLIGSLSAQRNLFDAVNTGLNVLAQLEEPFPSSVDETIRLKELVKTRNLLSKIPHASLVKIDVMKDKQKLAAMRFLNRMLLYSYLGRPEILPLVVCRALQLSLSHGVSKDSSYAFAVYGCILCGPMGDAREGYRIGKVALSLLDRFKARECIAQVNAGVYGFINPWIEPVHLSLDPLRMSHKAGLLAGDVEFAQVSITLYLGIALLHCGKPLVPLAEEMKACCQQIANYNQGSAPAFTRILWQTTLNLTSYQENPVELTGAVMDRKEELRKLKQDKNSAGACQIYLYSMWLAYLFQHYELAAEMAEKSRDIDQVLMGKIEIRKHTFFYGLTSLALARTSKLKKWNVLADKAIERMEKWASESPWNCQHMLELMNAERSFSAGDTNKAGKHYDEAISSAGAHGFIHDQALACERAGIFRRETGDDNLAFDFFRQSQKFYRHWGAIEKADQVECQM